MASVQRMVDGKPDGPRHVLTSDPEKRVNTMPFAATKCFLNMLGKGKFEISDEPATCRTCTKV